VYLSEEEWRELRQLPGRALTKTRHSIPPFGIDVFDPPLTGLLLAEIESDAAMNSFPPPTWSLAEVTADARFTGGRLLAATSDEVQEWLTLLGART